MVMSSQENVLKCTAPKYWWKPCKLYKIGTCHLKFIIHLCKLLVWQFSMVNTETVWPVQVRYLPLMFVCYSRQIYWYQKIVPFSDNIIYFIISEIVLIFWYRKFVRFSDIRWLSPDIRKWFSDIRKSFSDIGKWCQVLKSTIAINQCSIFFLDH